MKRYLFLVLLLLLPGCGKKQVENTTQSCEMMVRLMLARTPECEEDGNLFRWYLYDGERGAGLGEDSEYYSAGEMNELLSGFYGLDGLEWDDAAFVRIEGVRAFELAVLSVPEEERDTVVSVWQEYLLDRQGAFTGYEPEQAALVEDGKILTLGREVALLICESISGAQEAFEACYGEGRYAAEAPDLPPPKPEEVPSETYADTSPGEDDMTSFDSSAALSDGESGEDPGPAKENKQTPDAAEDGHEGKHTAVEAPDILPSKQEEISSGRYAYTAPGKDDMTLFDNAAILSAWRSGDDSGLSTDDKAVLDAARAVFERYVVPGMSDYDKERTLYTWLTENVRYDYSHYEPQGAPRTSYEPYGPLVMGKGVCLGYVTTFQLLMDMADVECITVVGAAFYSREDHAWNMVRLSGNWYCVDPTWDEGDPPDFFSYFNVTSDWMAQTDHQWDYASVPEATAEDHGQT